MKWNKENDIKPDYYKPVLVYGRAYDYVMNVVECICVAWRANDGEDDFYTIHHADTILIEVTHWTELPQKPE